MLKNTKNLISGTLRNALLSLGLASLAIAPACMPMNQGSGSLSTPTNTTTSTSATTLAINPNGQTIAPGSSLQLTATGGTAPYSYALIIGQGSLNTSNGLYTSTTSPSATSTSAEISATDANGNIAYATITISYPPLVISPSSITVAVGSTFTFTATGGSGAYSYSMAYGAGTIVAATGVYTAPSTSSSDQIFVTDSNGDEAFSTITVGTGGVSNGSSANFGCSLISATGDTGVSMTCDTTEVIGTYGQSATCGTSSSTGTSGTSNYGVACSGASTTATGSAYCCASPSREEGNSYTRTISGSATTYLQLYCGVGESLISGSGSCTSVTGTLPVTTLNNAANQPGYSINCATTTDTASLTLVCQGTTPYPSD